MTQQPDHDSQPDVEAVMADIRRGLDEAAGSVPAELAEARQVEGDLHANLARANQACRIGQHPGRGPKAMARRLLYRLLGSLIEEVNGFNGHVVRVLNQLVRVLEGQEDHLSGDLLAGTKQRMDLLAQMSRRLADYDRLNIEERLRRLEAQVAPAPEARP